MECEHCGSTHDGTYGSGRFCSIGCTKSFATSHDRKGIGAKISKKLAGRKRGVYVTKQCKGCGNQFKIRYGKRSQEYCRNDCRRVNPEGVHPVVGFRQRMKARSIEYKGGRCVLCGYQRCSRSLQFHHLDPSEKDFNIGGKSISWEKTKVELDKCVLVCANCHGEIHDGLYRLEEGKLVKNIA